MSNESGSPDACPPSLLWQDVRREYLAQSTAYEISGKTAPVSVRLLGQGPPLYLLPGFTCPGELYCLLVWLLRDDFQCVTIERPADDRLANRGSMSDDAQMVQMVADELGHDGMAIFGANLGAAWGLAAAREMPERISRLILLHGFAHRRLSFWERRLAWLCGLSSQTLSVLPGREALQAQNHLRWFPPFDPTRWHYYLEATGGMKLKELARRAQAVQDFDLRNDLKQIPVPALLIRTEGEGRVAADCQQFLEGSLPRVQVEWLHTTGQLPYLTHPHRLAKLMRAFCAERSPDAVSSTT